MVMRTKENYSNISFGKLSDENVVAKSPFSKEQVQYRYFSTSNIQYIVDNIADMFGYRQGTIKAKVKLNDVKIGLSFHSDDSSSIVLEFSMNAQINSYARESYYGKHFMYMAAETYGNDIVFGIVAHEVGHLVAHNAMNVIETKIVNGHPAMKITKTLNDFYDELCADYLAGIVLSKARPALSAEPIKNFLAQTKEDRSHPDGYWRECAVEMGTQWGKHNSPLLTDKILGNIDQQKNLLDSFCRQYYSNVYLKTSTLTRMGKTALPSAYMENSDIVLCYL